MEPYPKDRPQYFGMHVVKALVETEAGNSIGYLAYSLIACIAGKEDMFRYSRPIDFYDSQLMRVLGVTDQKELARARRKAVDAGWLQYKHGGRGYAGLYFVTMPAHITQATETTKATANVANENSNGTRRELEENSNVTETEPIENSKGTQRETSIPNPNPFPVPEDLSITAGTAEFFIRGKSPAFAEFWTLYPKKHGPGAAWKAWQGVIAKLCEVRKCDDATVEAWLLERTKLYVSMPAGMPPPVGIADFRPNPARWLEDENYDEPIETWKKPNGDNPAGRRRKRSVAGEAVAASGKSEDLTELFDDFATRVATGATKKVPKAG